MPTFTIYVTGGADMFYRALNAIAMLFQHSSIFDGVLLMGAMWAIIAGAWHYIQKNVGSGLLRTYTWVEHSVVLVLVATISVIPTRVNIQDIYGDQTLTAVDHVPLIFSFPSALFSGISHEIFTSVDTSFQAVTGSYLGVSQNGFTTPLNLLFSMRGGLEKTSGDFTGSLQEFMKDCTRNSAISSTGISKSTDLFKYIIENSRANGVTKSYIPANITHGVSYQSLINPDVISCNQAKDRLELRFEDILQNTNSSDINRLININMNEANEMDGSNAHFSVGDVESAHILLSHTGQSAQQFMQTSLVRNLVHDTYRCMNSTFDQNAFIACTQIQHDAMEAWKVDATAAGNIFTKTMYPMMTFLQITFFGFGAVVLLYSFLKGAGALKGLMAYALFGMWVFSWLPFVSIINAYIQWLVVADVSKLNTSGISFENYSTYMYDILSTNLAIASNMLAATPLVTLGLLSGSTYAMAGLAQRMSGTDYVTEQAAAPNTMEVSPGMRITPSHTGNQYMGTTVSDQVNHQFNVKDSVQEMAESSRMEAVSSQASAIRKYNEGYQSMRNSLSGTQYASSSTFSNLASDSEISKEVVSNARQFASDNNINKSDEIAGMQALQLSLGATVPGFAGANKNVSESEAEKVVANLSQGAKEVFSSGVDAGYQYMQSNNTSLSETANVLGGVVGSDIHSKSDAFEQSYSRAEQATEAYKVASSHANSIESNYSIDSQQLGAYLDHNTGTADYISREWSDIHSTHGTALTAATERAYNSMTANGRSDVPNARETAMLVGMQTVGHSAPLNSVIAGAAGMKDVQDNSRRNSGIATVADHGRANASGLGSNVGVTGGLARQGAPSMPTGAVGTHNSNTGTDVKGEFAYNVDIMNESAIQQGVQPVKDEQGNILFTPLEKIAQDPTQAASDSYNDKQIKPLEEDLQDKKDNRYDGYNPIDRINQLDDEQKIKAKIRDMKDIGGRNLP